jgi:hypothetical protein
MAVYCQPVDARQLVRHDRPMAEPPLIVVVSELKPYIGRHITVGDRSGELVEVRHDSHDQTCRLWFREDPNRPLSVPPSLPTWSEAPAP